MGGLKSTTAECHTLADRNTTTVISWHTLLGSKKITDMLILRTGSVRANLVASEKFYKLI